MVKKSGWSCYKLAWLEGSQYKTELLNVLGQLLICSKLVLHTAPSRALCSQKEISTLLHGTLYLLLISASMYCKNLLQRYFIDVALGALGFTLLYWTGKN